MGGGCAHFSMSLLPVGISGMGSHLVGYGLHILSMQDVFGNTSSEEDINLLTIAEIAHKQKKDSNLKTYFKNNSKVVNKKKDVSL